jgi:hypothetical protein
MRMPRLALLFTVACTAVGCVENNATDTPQEKAPESLPAIQSVPGATADALVQPYPDGARPSPIGVGMPLQPGQEPKNLIAMQRHTYTEFANTMGFGFARMIPPPGHNLPFRYASHDATLDFTQAYPPDSPWHGYWKVEKVQLIGTLHQPSGAAYDTKNGEMHRITAESQHQRDMAKQMNVGSVASLHSNGMPIREQTEFEKGTLAQLRAGAQLLVKHEPERLQVIGAIRAMTDNCKSCHSVSEGHLMGAFSYELKRVTEKPMPVPEEQPVFQKLP